MNDHDPRDTSVRPQQNPSHQTRHAGPVSGPPLRRLGSRATRVFRALVDGLTAGAARRVDNAAGTFMSVSVDCLAADDRGGALYALAHRYEVNGDLVSDPDVEFYVVADDEQSGGRAVYPTAVDHGSLGYRRYVDFDAAGRPATADRRGQADLARFCDGWMRNIAAQQRLVLR